MHIWKHLHPGKFNIKMDDVEISENIEEHTGNYTLSIVLVLLQPYNTKLNSQIGLI